jgi:hypothetical protein
MVEAICQSCGKLIELPDPATPRIMNLPAASVIVLEHPESKKCENCGLIVGVGISGIEGVLLTAIPLPGQAKPEPLIIMPGSRN